jgi:ABC-2 type transport system ATP-binding protein
VSADGVRVEVSGVSKTYGAVKAVDDLSFTVDPASVTGFLGPNGAGKTTTLRMLLGLARPDAGRALINGCPYPELDEPGHLVGALLEANSFYPGRSAINHLRVYCAALGVADIRADEVLAQVGLTPAARLSVGGFSTGMRQRLGLATALLGDPRVLVLDEPANGLDPEGIAWLRGFLRHAAHQEGRTVLVSSHVLSEVEQTVDRVVIITRGRLAYAGTLDRLRSRSDTDVVVVTPTPDALLAALAPLGVTAQAGVDGAIRVAGVTADVVGHTAWEARVELHELRTEQSSLEHVFLDLTEDSPRGAAAPPQIPPMAPTP